MRIVKEWNHQGWKFTVFHHAAKYHVKIEDGPVEHSFKIMDVDGFDLDRLKDIITNSSMSQQIHKIFIDLHRAHKELHDGFISQAIDDTFDTII
jgi:hypothetical protein